MFDSLGTLGRWLIKAVVIIVILGALIGYHQIGAAIGDLIHHLHTTVQTATNHAKNG